MSKPRGKPFRAAIRRHTGLLPDHAPSWDALTSPAQDDYHQAAAEYDKETRGELPADVESFVTKCLAKFPHSYGTHHTASVQFYVHSLVDIVREQGARNAELESEIAIVRKDVADAATELMVPIPEPGSVAAKMLIANRVLMRERDKSDQEWGAERQARILAEEERDALRERLAKLERSEVQ